MTPRNRVDITSAVPLGYNDTHWAAKFWMSWCCHVHWRSRLTRWRPQVRRRSRTSKNWWRASANGSPNLQARDERHLHRDVSVQPIDLLSQTGFVRRRS